MVLWDEGHLEEYVFPMIRKMTPMPAMAKNSFGTASCQHAAGDRADRGGRKHVAAECTPLGICDVELPPFLPKGSPVELTYEYNANQVLEVAVDACGNQASVSIERKTGLAPNGTRSRDGGLGRH